MQLIQAILGKIIDTTRWQKAKHFIPPWYWLCVRPPQSEVVGSEATRHISIILNLACTFDLYKLICLLERNIWKIPRVPKKLNLLSEGPQNGGQMIGMDILEFRDINQPAVMPKYGVIGQIVTWGCESPPPPCSIFMFNKSFLSSRIFTM